MTDKSSEAARRRRIDDGPWSILHATGSGIRRYIARGFGSKLIAQRELNDLLRDYPQDDPWRKALFVGEWPVAGQARKASSDSEGDE